MYVTPAAAAEGQKTLKARRNSKGSACQVSQQLLTPLPPIQHQKPGELVLTISQYLQSDIYDHFTPTPAKGGNLLSIMQMARQSIHKHNYLTHCGTRHSLPDNLRRSSSGDHECLHKYFMPINRVDVELFH